MRRALQALAACALAACAAPGPAPRRYDLFAPPASPDIWTAKIQIWQSSQRPDPRAPAAPDVAGPGRPTSLLAEDYAEFSREARSDLMLRVNRWLQLQSGLYFRGDGERDHWPTAEEVLRVGGDDCDGTDALGFALLRGFGFGKGEIYRAVLVDEKGARHHMVTLWFADGPAGDPRVLDPTGEVTGHVLAFSALRGWQPLALFDETDVFRPRAIVSP